MSKSRLNVVNPDDVVEQYGAHSMRLYEMFMGPLDAAKRGMVFRDGRSRYRRGRAGPLPQRLAALKGYCTAAALLAMLRSFRRLPEGQRDAYRPQKTVKADGRLGNVG